MTNIGFARTPSDDPTPPNIRVSLRYQPETQMYGLWIRGKGPAGMFFLHPRGQWVECKPGEHILPTAMFESDTAHSLLDDLLTAGVKPETMIESEGQKLALENHLNDMRAIVASKLKIRL